MLEIEPRVLYMLSKLSIAELHSQPSTLILKKSFHIFILPNTTPEKLITSFSKVDLGTFFQF